MFLPYSYILRFYPYLCMSYITHMTADAYCIFRELYGATAHVICIGTHLLYKSADIGALSSGSAIAIYTYCNKARTV